MIVRPYQHWFLRLFVWHGSVLADILLRLSLNLAMSAIAVIYYHWYEGMGLHLTTAPFSLLGIAIAIFLGFRNNASYARYTEARQLWGSLLITQRSLLRQIKSVLSDEQQIYQFSRLLIAFAWSLKHQLRRTDGRKDLRRLVPERYLSQVENSPQPTNRLLLCMGDWLGEQRRAGHISDMLYTSIDANLNRLSDVLGGCDRIANTPIPFAYTLILHRTVYLFCTLLPFALVNDLHYLTPLVSVFISYTFLSLESLAEELEEPFGSSPNDLPLNALCNGIEIILCEMIDQPGPPKMHPDANYILT
ncbi:MAG: bestrophin family ion channel [Mixta sp.]